MLRHTMVMICAASFASLAASAASAQPAGEPEKPQASAKFRSLDRNGDGYLTKDEVSAIRGFDKAFDEADENHDGKLSADEFVKADSLHDRQVVGGYVDDTTLTGKVKTALLRERDLKSMDVHVASDNGRVLLSGWVANDAQRRKAIAVASHVQGVKEVKDGMSVK